VWRALTRKGARPVSPSRVSGVWKRGAEGLQPTNSRVAKSKELLMSGPQYRRKCSGPSDQRGTRGARLGSIASSRIATLKRKDQLPPIHETRSAKASKAGFGPTILPRCSGSSDQRGTRGARLGSIASSRIDFEAQGSASSHPRDAKCRIGIWAHNIAEMFRVVRSERDTW
jgi:hypothetical protein